MRGDPTRSAPAGLAGQIVRPRFKHVGELLAEAIALPSSVRLHTFAGDLGDPSAPTVIHVRSPRTVGHLIGAPGELGLGRAFVCGDIEVTGDLEAVMDVRVRRSVTLRRPVLVGRALRELGFANLRPCGRPHSEARIAGRRHSLVRDRCAVDYHYEVPAEFFASFLGPTMAYTCAFFSGEEATLEEAQRVKFETVCRKLKLRPGMHLLDVGCGWGGLLVYAARARGCHVTGVTLGEDQVRYAREMAAREGVGHLVSVERADYRDVRGQFDAVSAVGVFEHIGLARRGPRFFDRVRDLLAPGACFLNHSISATSETRGAVRGRSFAHRYVFPDGELHEVGDTVGAIESAGLQVLHVEGFGSHYVRTAREWQRRLEAAWPDAVRAGGVERARVTRLFLAAYARRFARGELALHQVLARRPADDPGSTPSRSGAARSRS